MRCSRCNSDTPHRGCYVCCDDQEPVMDEDSYAERITELESRLLQREQTIDGLLKGYNEYKDKCAEYLKEICGLTARLSAAEEPSGIHEEYARAKALLEANGFRSTTRPLTYGILCLLQQENTTRAKLYEDEAAKIEEDEL